MPPLKQARHAILPAAAVAAAGVTVWVDTLRHTDVTRDDLCPATLTVILSVWALLAYYARRFWRETRRAKFENALASIAEGVRAEMVGRIDGDGQRAPRPRRGR